MTTEPVSSIDIASFTYPPPLPLSPPQEGSAHEPVGITSVTSSAMQPEFFERMRSADLVFVCVAAHTDTSSIPTISSAGASLELIPWTPAADLEALLHGRPVSLTTVPSNPLGPPGPALIARAALALGSIPWLPVTIGLRVEPAITTMKVQHAPGGRIDVEQGLNDSRMLYARGHAFGNALARRWGAVVIAETVPGGTTTAMAVLRSLGSRHRVSSSSSDDLLSLKQSVVDRALERAHLGRTSDVFEILDAVGDPMQPFVMGMLVSAAPNVPVLTAGGTQMAAVLAATCRLGQETGLNLQRSNVLLGTTPWVARDPQSDLGGILNDCGGWSGAVPQLDFSNMRCEPLRAYERLLVKEGVGAGGACVAALTSRTVSLAELHAEIDAQYLALLSDSHA
jgi:uncharacterized protein (TIGR00303 family)